jgi:hypothetical protein
MSMTGRTAAAHIIEKINEIAEADQTPIPIFIIARLYFMAAKIKPFTL